MTVIIKLLRSLWDVESAQSYNLPLDFIHAGLESTWGQIKLLTSGLWQLLFTLDLTLRGGLPDVSPPQTYSPILLCSRHLSVPDIMN